MCNKLGSGTHPIRVWLRTFRGQYPNAPPGLKPAPRDLPHRSTRRYA
jgi:hypothetical protein